MALQNIGASNKDDAFYRYKMPRMLTKIEGRGNGIKTNIVNMVDIAKALARPASYTTKYFGCELGAQSKFDEKTGISLVNGAHDTSKLAGLLENFIKKYVQCYGCGNPETEVLISKKEMITLKCAACGFLSDVDMRDKLTTFILKNPPEAKKGGKDKKAMRRAEKERLKEGEAADEEMKKLKKDGKKKGASSKESTAKGVATKKKGAGGSDEEHVSSPRDADFAAAADDDDDDDDDVQWATDTSAEAARKRMEEQLSAATAEMVMLATEETEKKKKQAQHKDDGGANGTAKAEETSNGNQNGAKTTTPYDALVEEIKASLANAATAAQLKGLLSSSPLPLKDVMDALFEALFHGAAKGFAKDVVKNRKYLAAAVPDEAAQMLLLQSIEAFCGKCSAEALKELPVVLKALYDGDVLEEETIVQWYNEAVAAGKDSQVVKNAKPVVEWLQSAESDEE
ncbi:eukaryotic translation initiation factor 5-like [Triticum dicoccoides]|uniref:eukaryotic translation initiation factor 5-like n=1 Tax=Triticum dicoccoides TaxID=85692 RepID=UPI000E799A03|nr:eukaryotic translation initiation factor 5-like [Triticum dicoccoides]